MIIFVSDRIENIVEKWTVDGFYQHFLSLPLYFQKASLLGSFKVGIMW